jgi:hypothetical protein
MTTTPAYRATFSGFRDADPDAPWPWTDDCVIFRVRDNDDDLGFVEFPDPADHGIECGRRIQITALYFREHDRRAAVEWSREDFRLQFEDGEPLNLTPITDLPTSWPPELRDFLADTVRQIVAAERGEDNAMSYRNQTRRDR